MSLIDFSQVHTRRSLTLLALGALAGLAIAGYGLFTAQGTATRGIPPEAMATVNGRLILRTDFVSQVQTQFGITFAESTQEQRDRVLSDMISEELMVQRGLEADLASYDPDVRQALVNGVELQIFADVLAQQPTEAQLKDYYEKHQKKYMRDGIMQLRDLMLTQGPQGSSPEPAQSAHLAVEELRHGAALETVMTKYELKDSRKLLDSGHVDTGDVFDFSAWARLDPKVFEVASAMKSGQISDPIAAADGVHLVVMVKREPPEQRQFKDVSNEVWADIKKEAQEKVRLANVAYLKSKADIKTAGAQ
ncbi:MAG TPA: peptidyl-prolyl cis-trans isomerase [Steroidobacteraceae bacterium]|nr:peptidyl-prolyl cis-trans isomerase [Steroidobacteraceae bacterium]